MLKQFGHSCFQSNSSKTEEILPVTILRDVSSFKKYEKQQSFCSLLYLLTLKYVSSDTPHTILENILQYLRIQYSLPPSPSILFCHCWKKLWVIQMEGGKCNWCSWRLAMYVYYIYAMYATDPDLYVEILCRKKKINLSGENEEKSLCHCRTGEHEATNNCEDAKRLGSDHWHGVHRGGMCLGKEHAESAVLKNISFP